MVTLAAARRIAACALALPIATFVGRAEACPDYANQVPNSLCETCHTSAMFSAPNTFGLAYDDRDIGGSSGCVVGCAGTCSGCTYIDWSSCGVRNADTDGDGFTNDEELTIGTAPSEPSSVDECATVLHRCTSDATCTADGAGRHDYTCACPAGLAAPGSDGRSDGNGCLDIDECTAGTHDCGLDSTCSNTRGSFDCPCNPGFFGSGHAGQGCTTTDFCAPGPCGPLSHCESTPGGATCAPCPVGYQGDPAVTGCTSIDACATDNGGCSPRVACVTLPGGRSCGACPAGWAGSGVGANGCSEDVCAPCSAFATCTPGATPVCACNTGFIGDGASCRDVDECAPGGSARCGEHMQCANLFGSYECTCAGDGYLWQGDACVLGALAFTRVDSSPAPMPAFPESASAAASSSGCAIARQASPSQRAKWSGLFVAAVSAAAWQRRRMGRRRVWMAAAVGLLGSIGWLGCGNGSDLAPDGTGGTPLDVGSGGSAGAGGNDSAGGSAGTNSAGSGGGAPVRHCAASRECASGEWCNPRGDECQRRDSPGTAYTFQHVHEILEQLTCPSCHRPGGEADFATTTANLGPLLFDDFELAYRHLVADGVSCRDGQRRLCVEEPRASLLITKVFEGLNEKQELVVFRDWSDETLQTMLRWIASGAPRRGPSCGNRVLDPGEQCDQGLTPPARCAYGETTCELCTPGCTLATPSAGPYCGDGNVDDGHETCDDGNSLVESAPANGGPVCGSQCTFVPGL